MLSFEPANDQRLDLPGLFLTPIAPEGAVAKFDLTLSLTDSAAGLRGSLDYGADLFAPETAAQFARLLARMLTAAAAAPQARLSALLEPGDAEQAALADLERGPDLAAPSLRSIPAQVADWAARAPAAIAVLETGRLLTYRDLVDRARGLARTLRARGVGPEAVVAVCLPRSAGLVIAQLATWFAGGAYLPLDPAHPPERLRALVREAGARAVITQGALEEIFTGSRLTLLDWENAEPEPDQPVAEVEDGQLAYVIFTSGLDRQAEGGRRQSRRAGQPGRLAPRGLRARRGRRRDDARRAGLRRLRLGNLAGPGCGRVRRRGPIRGHRPSRGPARLAGQGRGDAQLCADPWRRCWCGSRGRPPPACAGYSPAATGCGPRRRTGCLSR